MTPLYEIRRARADELPRLPEIEQASGALFFGHGVSAEALNYITPLAEFVAGREAGLLWVAVDASDAPIGFALLEMIDGCPHLEEIDVLPEHARQGMGRALIEEVCRWARARGHTSLTLTTFRDVPWNAPYYQRLGFQELPAAEWSVGLQARVAEEAAHGLDPARRVVMVRRIE